MGLFPQAPDMPLPTRFNIFAFADDAFPLPAFMPGMGMSVRSQCEGAGSDLSNANRMIVARLAQDHTRL